MKNSNSLSIVKIYFGCLMFFLQSLSTVSAQVKIGDNPNAIDASSLLELESTSRALVLTRVRDNQMLAITPIEGAIVYNIDQQCVFYFSQSIWQNLCAQGSQTGGTGATLVDNEDNTYTFTDRSGNETIIAFDSSGGETLIGEAGSIFFAGADGNATENNAQLFWDNTSSSLGIGTNTGLNDNLTVNGTLGVSNGSATVPSYRFLNDADSGMYRIGENEIGFVTAGNEIMRMDENSMILNDALTPANNNIPLIIRGNGPNREFIGFQLDANPDPLYRINIRGAGLNFDNINRPHQLFLSIFPEGNVGIGTATPSETLDVVGTLRVRDLAAAQTTDNFVTVDANGVFHRSVTNSLSGRSAKGTADNFSARWTNNTARVGLKFGKTIAPIFSVEKFKDGVNDLYEVKSNTLKIKTSGRYELKANISLIGANTSVENKIASISARVYVNSLAVGAINVAANNGSKNDQVLSSIVINELLQLESNDVISIKVSTDAFTNTIFFNSEGTSNFAITKMH